MIAMQDVKYLPKPKQAPLIELQRKLTERVSELLQQLNPGYLPMSTSPTR
jgi:hypothetical protein